jgi:hypothetical protein
MHDQSKIPQWKAPETLLPRVLKAIVLSQPRLSGVSAAGMLMTAILCVCTGFALAMVLGLVPAPSAGLWVSSTSKAYNLILLGQRLSGNLFALILCHKLLFSGAVIYGAFAISAGVAGIGGIVYLVNHVIIPRSEIK